MMMALDALQKLFGRRERPVTALRGIGLALLDSLPTVKNRIMRYAMGLDGDLPEVAMLSPDPEFNQ
jgi:2-octaprenyl-3-methyl-6-methoxy-1,4-benzoquinol hydroxylase